MALSRRNKLSPTGWRPAHSFLVSDTDEIIPRCVSNWPIVRDYLVGKRMIPPQIVDTLHEAGMIYADNQTPEPNVVYLHRDARRKVLGVSVCGISDPSVNLSYRGEKNTAWFYIGDLMNAHKMVTVESPIDALSFYVLKGSPSMVIASCPGSIVPDELLQCALNRKQSLTVAFNNTEAGMRGWQKACDDTAGWKRFEISFDRPLQKDWNAELTASIQATRSIKI